MEKKHVMALTIMVSHTMRNRELLCILIVVVTNTQQNLIIRCKY